MAHSSLKTRKTIERYLIFVSPGTRKKLLRLDELIDVGNCLGVHALRVELMCAEYAFSAQRDIQASARMSLRLVANDYSECWRLCSALGSSSNQLMVKTRLTLLSFALSHCPASQVPGLLDEWQRAQVEEQRNRRRRHHHHLLQ